MLKGKIYKTRGGRKSASAKKYKSRSTLRAHYKIMMDVSSKELVRRTEGRWHHATTNDLPPLVCVPTLKEEGTNTNEGGRKCKRFKRSWDEETNIKNKKRPGEASKSSLKRNTTTTSNQQPADSVKRPRGSRLPDPNLSILEEEIDFNILDDPPESNVSLSKLPIPDKLKPSEEVVPLINEKRTMPVKGEDKKIIENPINMALAHRIEELQAEQERLVQENAELREELDLMEFRMLEMDTSPKRAVSRSSETRYDVTELDDVSDSGVMSLPTSEDDPQDYGIEDDREKDVKWRLMEMCRSVETVADRICLQQAMALIRHQESRLEGLEATIAAISHEARNGGEIECKRIVATVPPFSEPRLDITCLGERNFDQGNFSCSISSSREELFCVGDERSQKSRGTQTEGFLEGVLEGLVASSIKGSGTSKGEVDLSLELKKLTRVKERIEERGAEPKEVVFYRERVEALEQRLSVFESSGDTRVRALARQVQRETLLEAKVKQLNQRIAKLEIESKRIEEERCELEEAENDTRLRCQKLESKLSTLGEKKTALKVQIEEANETMASLKHALESEEKKKNEAREYASKMGALVQSYEQKNKELEEREMEVRYRLQMFENTLPALVMLNVWRIISLQGPIPAAITAPVKSEQSGISIPREEELMSKLKFLEEKLDAEAKLLDESRYSEEALREKVKVLENILNNKSDDIVDVFDKDSDQDLEVLERLSKMAKDRMELKKRIKDLEQKERFYQETLSHADTMFAEMEGGYVEKIKKKEEELENKEARLAENETKLKQKTAEISFSLLEKIDSLEVEVNSLKLALSRKEREREVLEAEEKRLHRELQECLDQLDEIKKNVEGPLRLELDLEKKRSKGLEENLKKTELEASSKEEAQIAEVSALKRQISRLSRELMENEVTIGELKEEVQTLETEVFELRKTLANERTKGMEALHELEARLELKEKQVEELELARDGVGIMRKSLKEELEEGIADLETNKCIIVINPKQDDCFKDLSSSSKCDVFRITSQVALHGESFLGNGELKNITNHQDVFMRGIPKRAQRKIHTENSKEIEGGTDPNIINIKSSPITEIDQSQSTMNYPMASSRNPDCLTARKAVAGVNGKDPKTSVDNLTKAYEHSKICQKCGGTLGGFLGDLVSQLGVQLPKTKGLERKDVTEYGGEPSTLEQKTLGPGTVAWNSLDNKAGYRIKPTVSSLQLAVSDWMSKCRIKDHLIQSLADELIASAACGVWTETNLLDSILKVPNPVMDFDRTNLVCYLRQAPYHTLDLNEEEKELQEPLKATNPLGLTVLRQVGPDGLLLEWNPPPPEKRVYGFEIFVNGLFAQRIHSSSRTKAIIYPIDLSTSSKVLVTLNAITYDGESCETATIPYPKK